MNRKRLVKNIGITIQNKEKLGRSKKIKRNSRRKEKRNGY